MKAALPPTALATAEILGALSGITSTTISLSFGVGLAFWQLDKAVELVVGMGGVILGFAVLAGKGRCPIDTSTAELPFRDTVAGRTIVGVLVVAVVAILVLASVRNLTTAAAAVTENPADWALAGFLIFHLGFFLMRPGGLDPWLGRAEWLLPVVAIGGASLLALSLFLRAEIAWINATVGALLISAETFLWLQRPHTGSTPCEESFGIVFLGTMGFAFGAMPGWIPRLTRRMLNRDQRSGRR